MKICTNKPLLKLFTLIIYICLASPKWDDYWSDDIGGVNNCKDEEQRLEEEKLKEEERQKIKEERRRRREEKRRQRRLDRQREKVIFYGKCLDCFQ